METSKRFKLIPAVYLVLERENSVCLLQRQNTGFMDGYFSLIAGHLDGAETAKTGMVREAAEEAGIIIQEDDLIFSHILHKISPEREGFDLFFTCQKWQGEIRNIEETNCSCIKFFDYNSLPDMIAPHVKQTLDCIKNNVYYSEYGWDDMHKQPIKIKI